MDKVDMNGIGPGELRRFRRLEFDRIVRTGALDDQPVELLHGLLVAKEPQGNDHASTAAALHRMFVLRLGAGVEVRSHSPLAASDDSEPEPDVAVVPARYARADHPTSAHLLVEVSRSSLQRDRAVKSGIYAAAGVPEYWIVNLVEQTIEVRSEPESGTYRRLRTYRAGERITPVAFPEASFEVSEILLPQA